ncbi:MAG: TonB family protein [Betaproteobacteria bacterium]|nr:TonB family protein [Betaproteobacteria bacterium]
MFKHWLFPWKAGAAKPAKTGSASVRTATPARAITAPRKDNFAQSLLLSMALHALLLTLQFGDSGSGLPWFGVPGTARNVSAPSLNAILRSQVAAEKPVEEQVTTVVVSDSRRHVAKPLVREPPPPRLPPEPAAASIAKLVTLPQETGEKGRAAGAVADVPKIDAPDKGSTVLSTDKPGEWSLPAAKSRLEDEAREEPAVVEKAGAAPPVLEQKMIEDLARIEEEKAALAAVAREKELVLERQRAEELAHLEEKKAEQAAARAREEVLAKQAEAEAMARKRQAEKAAAEKALAEKLAAEKALAEQAAAERAATEKAVAEKIAAEKVAAEKAAAEKAAAERSLAEEQSRLKSAALGNADGSKTAGTSALTGSELARRALGQARNAPSALPGREPAELARPRRGSILGRDPKDIQLAFYGDSWRLKVERIGSLNYPKLSKNLVYEPLVVTVSINSDGTLAAVRIDKSSGHRELDEAVRRILEMSAPFSAFPPDLKRSYDVIDITRTWTFLEERPRIVSQ